MTRFFLSIFFATLVVAEWSGLFPYQIPGILLLVTSCGVLLRRATNRGSHETLQLFAGAYTAGAVLYFLLLTVLEQPIAYFFRMFTYPSAHPFSYLALMALAYCLTGSFWLRRAICRAKGVKRWGSLFGVVTFSVVIAAPFGGILWVLHDWRHRFVPSYPLAVDALIWGFISGCKIGPLIFLLSQPLSGLSMLFGMAWLDRIQRRSASADDAGDLFATDP